MSDATPVGLKELIATIKSELLAEHDATPLFLVGQVELEISFTVERDLNGGINLQIVQAGVDRKTTDVQVVKVTLEPALTVDELRKQLSDEQKAVARKGLTREYRG